MQALWAPLRSQRRRHHKLASLTSNTTTTTTTTTRIACREPGSLYRRGRGKLGSGKPPSSAGKHGPRRKLLRAFLAYKCLGEAPALFQQDAESFSNQGGAPAYRMYSKSSASNSAFSLEEPMSRWHKLSEVLTKLSIMATCLQECISTMVELQSDSFNQQEDAHLGMRESSLGSLTSRNIGNNNKEQEEKRSSLGELTPRICRSKSEDELEQDKLEQEEAKQQEQQEQAEARQLTAQQKGPANQQQQQKPQEKQKQLPKHKRWCNICWKKGHTTEACWYNYQQQNQQHQQAWMTPSQMQQQSAAASVTTTELRPTNYSLTLGEPPMHSLQQVAQASIQRAYPEPQQSLKNSLGQHKNIEDSWATILVDTGAAISAAPRSFAPQNPAADL